MRNTNLVSVKELALSLPADAWKKVTWRQGVKQNLQSRFAALRVRPAHRDYERSKPHPEEWLLIEWPTGEPEPTKYWLSTVPADTPLAELVHLAKHRWIIERDYQELKQELGLGTTKDAVGEAFIITPPYASRPMDSWWPNGIVFPPQPASAILDYQPPNCRQTSGRAVRRVRPERHNPRSLRLCESLARQLVARIPHCPFCGRAPVIFRIDIRIDDTRGGTRMVGRGLPGTFHQFHGSEFLQDDATPIFR